MSGVDVLRYCRLTALPPVHLKFDSCNNPWPAESHYTQIKGDLTLDPQTHVIESWRAYSPKRGLLYEFTTQGAPGGARVLAANHLNLNAAKKTNRDHLPLVQPPALLRRR